MSYAENVRGALALVSGIARRVQSLHELGLPEQYETTIQECLDAATDSLITVQEILSQHGYQALGDTTISQAAKAGRTARLMEQATKPWKSVKDQVKERGPVRTPAPKRKRTYDEVFPEDNQREIPVEAPQVVRDQRSLPNDSQSHQDAAHPWRSE